jgi:spore coat protein CotH
MRILYILVLSTFVFQALKAQQAIPEFGPAFRQDVLANIHISIHPDTLQTLLDQSNWGNEREFPANFRYEAPGDTQEVQNIGFRLRGNTSLSAQKKSFKVSFNTYSQGAKWNGLEKLNLNGHHNDPAHIRAKLCWDLFRDANLPASRTSFVKLFVNDEYRGIYTNVEHIDEEFVKLHINGIGRSNLYKCFYPAPLQFISYDSNVYKEEVFGRRPYQQKINDFADDYRDLARLIEIINNTSVGEFPCALESVFNVDRYLRYTALEILMGHWDNYAYNQNNYYLYKNELSGLFEYLPYDLDNTLGIDWVNNEWANRNVYQWSHPTENRPLFTRIMNNANYRKRFSNYLNQYLQNVFTVNNITERINTYFNQIDEAIQLDTFRTLDYGFTYEDFIQSPTDAFGGHVRYAILPYANERMETALNQLDSIQDNAAFQGLWINHDYPITNTGTIHTILLNNQSPPSWEWSTDGLTWNNEGSLFDNGLGPDLIANDNVFSASLPQFPLVDKIKYRVKLNDVNSNLIMPCQGRTLYLTENEPTIIINEFMAQNSATIADEFGEYDDWIELWNSSAQPINLRDYYLTDDQSRTTKFPLPDSILQSGEFILFWADNDHRLLRNHCNFALSANGEDLRLYKQQSNELRLANRIAFGAQLPNISLGRQTDGNSQWVPFILSTPGESNNPAGMESTSKQLLSFYPNPAKEIIYFNHVIEKIYVRDLQGRICIKSSNTNQLDLETLKPGQYFIQMNETFEKLIVVN